MKLIANQYWNDVQFNGAEVKTNYVSCLDKESPYDDYGVMHKVIRLVMQNTVCVLVLTTRFFNFQYSIFNINIQYSII